MTNVAFTRSPIPTVLVLVTVVAKSETRSELERTLAAVVADARALRGCRRYDWYRSVDDSNGLFICAEFESDEAFTAYRSGPEVARIGREILPLLERRPAFTHVRATVFEEG